MRLEGKKGKKKNITKKEKKKKEQWRFTPHGALKHLLSSLKSKKTL